MAVGRRSGIRRFSKFLVVGVLNSAVGYLLFAGLLQFSSPELALLLATGGGVVFNYFTTGRFVFENHGYREMFPFILGYALVYGVNLAAIYGLGALGIGPAIGQFLCLPGLAVLSYFTNSYLVFEKKR